MRVARFVTWLGVCEIAAVLLYGAGFYLALWGPLPQESLAVFVLGAVMILGGTCYAAGWNDRGEHERVRAWRAGAVASLPAGAGPVDASLDTPDGNVPEVLFTPRVDRGNECAFGAWLGERPGRARCHVPRCHHVATEPRGPGWSRIGNGGWLCPCESRHDLLAARPPGAM